MRVTLKGRANNDIREIRKYLSEFGQNQPKKFLAAFKTFRRQVAAMPYMFNLFEYNPRYRVATIIYDYLVFYRVEDGVIKVIRVLHSSRNTIHILDEENGRP